jgi:DNA replication protein DnaC
MESSEILWQQCLQLIREKVSQRVYDVWFAPITLDSYDAGKNAVMLRLPSRYIYEYIEECQVRLMGWALGSVYGTNVKLGYRIVDDKPDTMPTFDFPEPPQIPHFKIPGARARLEKGLKHFMGDKAVWLPCYGKVADWLTDNKGRGLLCIGTPGLGKTRICCDILPVFLKEMFGKEPRVTTLCENDQELPALLKERVVIVDGLGREDEKIFGKKNTIFQKLCDCAERQGTLLIITTHLSTTPVDQQYRHLYPLSIQECYGNEVLSRLRATTTVVGFNGKDLR